MTKDEKFHADFDALAARLQDYCRIYKTETAVVLVGRGDHESAITGNVCRSCIARVLTMTLENLADHGITPDSECDNSDDHPGVVVGHA